MQIADNKEINSFIFLWFLWVVPGLGTGLRSLDNHSIIRTSSFLGLLERSHDLSLGVGK